MSDKIILYIIALVLATIGLGFTYYKVHNLHFPLLPNQQIPVWTIGATVHFEATDNPIEVLLSLPTSDSHLTILDSSQSSDGYGFHRFTQGKTEFAQWTKRKADGEQTLYFKINAIKSDPKQAAAIKNTPPKPVEPPILTSESRHIALSMIDKAFALSSDNESFTRELITLLNAPESSALLDQLLHDQTSRSDKAKMVVDLLHLANIPAQLAMGVEIHTSKRFQYPLYFVETYLHNQWITFNPITAEQGIPDGTILWHRGAGALFDVTGGKHSSLTFSVIKSPLSAKQVAMKTSKLDETATTFLDFSIYSLPIASQKAFKTILLVPIGALIIVFLRIIVGIRTSGTFMPILIALAFIQTHLIPGLLMFVAIVSTGLLIRFLLSSLNLLLVARISAVIIVVIMIMAGFSIVSTKLGLNQVMTITFFPMIILAWTIERMSILWEEEGPKEVLIQGGGSLLMACIAYLAMSNVLVKYLSFNFPELLLVILALLLLMGQYTGYRLTELYRFKSMTKRT